MTCGAASHRPIGTEPGGEQERVGRARVVRLTAEHELQHDHDHAGQRDRAEAAGRRAAQRPDHARHPDRGQRWPGIEDLSDPVRGPVVPGRALQGAVHVQVRPAVRRLPDDGGGGRARAPARTKEGTGCVSRPGTHAGRVSRHSQARKPAVSAAARKSMSQVASLPALDAGPNGQPPARIPVASRRMARSSATAQNMKSGVVVVSSCMVPRWSPHVVEVSAAMTWPAPRAPSSLLMGREQDQRGEGERGNTLEPSQCVAGRRGGQSAPAAGSSCGGSKKRMARRSMRSGRIVVNGPSRIGGLQRHFDAERGGRDRRRDDGHAGPWRGTGPAYARPADCHKSKSRPQRRGTLRIRASTAWLISTAPPWGRRQAPRIEPIPGNDRVPDPHGRSAAAARGRTIGT